LSRSAIQMSPKLKERRNEIQLQVELDALAASTVQKVYKAKIWDPVGDKREAKKRAMEHAKQKSKEMLQRRHETLEKQREIDAEQRRLKEAAAGQEDDVVFMGMTKTVAKLVFDRQEMEGVGKGSFDPDSGLLDPEEILENETRFTYALPWKDPLGYSFSKTKVQMRGGAEKKHIASVDL